MIINKILPSIESVAKKAKYVRFVKEKTETFVNDIDSGELDNADIKGDKSLASGMDPEEHIAYAVINGTLQFCFWGHPKWTIEIHGAHYDGSEALIRSIKRATTEGYKLLDPRYLFSINNEDLKMIFRGNTVIPLLEERVNMLRELGSCVIKKYSGLFSNIITEAKGDVNVIVENLVRDMPSVFDDTAYYDERPVHFYKRAQIVCYYLSNLSKQGIIPHKIFGREGLSGLADYRVPQILRDIGILKYNEYLENLVDNQIEIPAGSEEEIEIRVFTLKAEHEIALALKSTIPDINDSVVHRILWFRSQKLKFDKPYHKTKTIWY